LSVRNKIDFARFEITCHNCSLSELCLPRGLSLQEIDALDTVIENKPILQRGEKIYVSDQVFKSLYAVKSGSMKIYSESENGEEHVLGFFMPGELLGLDGIGSSRHMCTAVALETTSLCEIPYDRLESLCHRFTGLQKEIYHVMGKEIADDKSLLLLLGKRTADERLATFLLSLSNRFKDRGFSGTEFNLSMARQDIANYLGLATETVSRIFGKLQEDNILSVNRRLVQILDIDKLNAIVNPDSGTE